jgi:hypothetical protein
MTLTARQKMLLEYVIQQTLELHPPTLREIGTYMGIKSTNGVNDHLKALRRKGYLELPNLKSRAFHLTQMALRYAIKNLPEYSEIAEAILEFRLPTEPLKSYMVEKPCRACKGGAITTPEGRQLVCHYCKGTLKIMVKAPHPSHKMTKEEGQVRSPTGNDPRLYGVRHCIHCKREELQHPAGHFLNGLDFPCTGKVE